MSNVRLAISRLGQVVNNLEGSMGHLEVTLAGEQRDMFSAPAAPVANGNDSNIDKEAVAKRLDSAIETIETMLSEDNGASGNAGEKAHG